MRDDHGNRNGLGLRGFRDWEENFHSDIVLTIPGKFSGYESVGSIAAYLTFRKIFKTNPLASFRVSLGSLIISFWVPVGFRIHFRIILVQIIVSTSP